MPAAQRSPGVILPRPLPRQWPPAMQEEPDITVDLPGDTTYRFSRIVRPDEFLGQGITHYIDVGRNIINSVDEDICAFLANFNLVSIPHDDTAVPEEAIRKLNGADASLITSMIKYVDFSRLSPELRDQNIATLAGFIASRFTAISLIAHTKKLEGSTDCFDKARHHDVLSKKLERINAFKGDGTTGSQAFSDMMDAGCVLQNAYLNDQEPKARPIARKLESLGVTPV